MSLVFELQDRVAVVSGALGLLGQQHVRALAKAGATLVVTDLDADACRDLAGRVAREHGIQTLGVAADVTDPESVGALAEAVLSRFGRVDVLVNNAAIDDKFESPSAAAELARFENYPVKLWRRTLDVNVTGTFLMSQRLGTEMARHRRGSIVNIASTYGLVAPQQSLYQRPDGSQTFWKGPAYPTSKGAVLQFTRFLAAYWGSAGVRVNALCPGGVENEQTPEFIEGYSARTPLGRMARRSDYQGALLFLASDASSYMTGASLVVDGGWTAW